MGPQMPLKLDMLVRADSRMGMDARASGQEDPVDVLWTMRTRINDLQEELAKKAKVAA